MGDAVMQLLLAVSNMQRVPKQERKLKVDSRFKRMFTDKSFKVKCTPTSQIYSCACLRLCDPLKAVLLLHTVQYRVPTRIQQANCIVMCLCVIYLFPAERKSYLID